MRRDRTDRARDFLHYVEIFETSILRCSRLAQARDNFFPAPVDLLKIAVQTGRRNLINARRLEFGNLGKAFFGWSIDRELIDQLAPEIFRVIGLESRCPA
jgi:hypothetical protein